jgi:hypothetical protein
LALELPWIFYGFFFASSICFIATPAMLSKGLWLSKRSGLMQGSTCLNNFVFPLLSNLFVLALSSLPQVLWLN